MVCYVTIVGTNTTPKHTVNKHCWQLLRVSCGRAVFEYIIEVDVITVRIENHLRLAPKLRRLLPLPSSDRFLALGRRFQDGGVTTFVYDRLRNHTMSINRTKLILNIVLKLLVACSMQKAKQSNNIHAQDNLNTILKVHALCAATAASV